MNEYPTSSPTIEVKQRIGSWDTIKLMSGVQHKLQELLRHV